MADTSVTVCIGHHCRRRWDSPSLLEDLRQKAEEQASLHVTLRTCGCIDHCEEAPVALVHTGGQERLYRGITSKGMADIIETVASSTETRTDASPVNALQRNADTSGRSWRQPEENRSALDTFVTRVTARRGSRLDAPEPILRAMENVKLAIHHKAQDRSSSQETRHAIASILDRAVTEIERI